MRVALVGPGYPPTRGGVEMVVAQTARALARAGVEVEVMAEERRRERPTRGAAGGDDGGGAGDAAGGADGAVVVRRFASNRAENFRVSPGLVRYLATHRGDYDVVHAHSYHAPVALGAALAMGGALAGSAARSARHEGPIFVLSPHYHGGGHSPARSILHHLYRPLGRYALSRARQVVCVSRAEAALVGRHFPDIAGRLTVIPNGVDAAAIRAARPLPEEPPTVLAVGRLAPYKRLDLVIEGFERWLTTGSRSRVRDDAQLVIVGSGPDQPRLDAIVARLGLGARVRLLSGLSDQSLHRWLRTASVLCSMSEHEAYGLAPAESLVAGTPVVLSAIPAHRELAEVAGAGAVTVVEPDPAALARALEARFAALPDQAGPFGEATLAGGILGWDDVATKLCRAYQEAIWAEMAGMCR